VKYAKILVDYLRKKYSSITIMRIIEHHIVYYTKKDGLEAIKPVIYYLESYDQTTIRASTAMWLLMKCIKETTDIKIVMSGECADELFGSYKYLEFAPNANEFDLECRKLLKRICYYDSLRADRVISSVGMEARFPFSDIDFITEVLSTECRYQPDKIEKYLIRDILKNYLPEEVLWRSKSAFSNSVSSTQVNWIDDIKKYCNFIKTTENDYYMKIFKSYEYDEKQLPYGYWHSDLRWIEVEDSSALCLPSKKN
jgi:asparagine synthase (glutamine-hydrolysing)